MNFEYNRDVISTQDDIKISVADLRDLIQAYNIKLPEQAFNEYVVILEGILRKNSFEKEVMLVVV